jgi:uncharacterized protein
MELAEGIMTEITGTHPRGVPNWVDLGVPDLARAKDFYGALFGWEFVDGQEETGYYTMCLLRGKPVAALAPSDDDSAGHWWNVYFSADDVDGAAKRITDGGGTLVLEPVDVMDQGRMLIAKDPAGAQFGLWHGRAHTGAQIVNEPGSACWHELTTADTAAAAAATFYGSVLDRPVESMGVPGFDYRTVKVGEESVAGVYGVPGDPVRWTVYFAVDDADEAARKVTEAGGAVTSAAKDSPYGRFAVVTDPFGAELAVMRTAG